MTALLLAGIGGLTGFLARLRFDGAAAWIAGAVSGFFGGLVGNQGSLRSAALLGFALQRDALVATATAIALLVDAARLPVYLWMARNELWEISGLVGLVTAGVALGTIFGTRLLGGIPETLFRRIVSMLLLLLGAATLVGVLGA